MTGEQMKKIILTAVILMASIGVSYAQADFAEQQKKLQESVDNVSWKNLTVDFYDVKDKAQNGYKAMTVKSTDEKNGQTFYVAKKPILSLQDTRSMDVSYVPGDGQMMRLMVRFNAAGQKTLADYSTANLNQMMGVVIDGKLRLVATLRQPLTNGRVQVYGFTPEEAANVLDRYFQPKLEAVRKFNQQMAGMKDQAQ